MILSVLYVRFRDILPIWNIVAQVLFYGSPVIYPALYYGGADSRRRRATARSPRSATS